MLKQQRNFTLIITLFLLAFSCEKTKSLSEPKEEIIQIDEKNYVLDSTYQIGDARRYGIYPDGVNNNMKHPNTGKYKIQTLLDFAEESQITINFPKGYYGINIIIQSRENVNLHFNQSEFNLIHITDEQRKESKNINLKGTLILYNQFGSYNSRNIELDSLILKSDINKNLEKLRNKGCHIYKGTKNLNIKYLEVNDLGSGEEKYKNTHAALAIDGQDNNPQKISIQKTLIKSSDRHGAYITGSNHFFEEIVIEKYGLGSTDGMKGMQDANFEDAFVLSGLWINRCNDCIFNSVTITTKHSQNGIPLKLDEGNIDAPTFINKLNLDVNYRDSLVLDNEITNVLVKKVEITSDK